MEKLIKTRSPLYVQYNSLPAEVESTNFFTYSEDLNNWTGVNVSVTANDTISPDGDQTADKVSRTSTGANYIEVTATKPNGTAAQAITASVFVKQYDSRYASFRVQGQFSSGRIDLQFDFETETINYTEDNNLDMQLLGTTVEQYNGWYRIGVSVFTDVYSAISLFVSPKTDANEGIGDGDSSDDVSLFVWGGQFESLNRMTSYIPNTAASTTTRAATTSTTEEEVTAELRIWEGANEYKYDRTNLVGLSENVDDTNNNTTGWNDYKQGNTKHFFVTGQQDPLGGNTATKYIVRDLNTSSSYSLLTTDDYLGSRFTPAGDYTISMYLKGDVGGEKVRVDFRARTSTGLAGEVFTLTTEWQRYSFTVNKAAAANNSGGIQFRFRGTYDGIGTDFSFDVWGVQAELSSSMTDYIPSTGGTGETVKAYTSVDKPNNATYTLSKFPTNGLTTFEISELIRDYIDQSSSTSTGSIWANIVLGDSNALNKEYTFLATEGYCIEGDSIQTALNSSNSARIMQTNTNLFIPEGMSMEVPVYVNNESAFYSLNGGASVYLPYTQGNNDQIQYITLNSTDTSLILFDGFNILPTINVVETDCTKYAKNMLTFVNRFGAKQDFYVEMKSTERVNATYSNFKRNTVDFTDFTKNIQKHNKQKRIKDSKVRIVLNTGFIDEQNAKAVEELLVSEYVWLTRQGEDAIPVNVEFNNVERKTHLNDKLIQYTIRVESSAPYLNNYR